MTTEEIQKRIDNIRAMADDDKSAHGQEDKLREDFIRYVSTLDNPSLAAKAKLVLTTEDIGFARWCAERRSDHPKLGASTGSAPWAWTQDRNMEYWSAGGKTREQAIWEGKRRGRKIFWIACTRPMTEDEKEEMGGSWVIDPTTEEKIMPNNLVSNIHGRE